MSGIEEREPRVYLVAGEASGDRLAADLLRELKKNPKLRAFGVGGPMLKAAGQEQSLNLAKHAVVGLTDVLKNLPKFLKIFREVKHEIAEVNPDVVVLVVGLCSICVDGWRIEGEGHDRRDLSLPGMQNDLVAAVVRESGGG